MDKTSKTLRFETEKWLSKIEKERSKIQIVNDSKEAKQAVKNLDAYISDSRHFLEKGDFVRSFEAVIYAWGIMETLERLGFLEKK